jgi:hypothetical protein
VGAGGSTRPLEYLIPLPHRGTRVTQPIKRKGPETGAPQLGMAKRESERYAFRSVAWWRGVAIFWHKTTRIWLEVGACEATCPTVL